MGMLRMRCMLYARHDAAAEPQPALCLDYAILHVIAITPLHCLCRARCCKQHTPSTPGIAAGPSRRRLHAWQLSTTRCSRHAQGPCLRHSKASAHLRAYHALSDCNGRQHASHSCHMCKNQIASVRNGHAPSQMERNKNTASPRVPT